MDLTVSLAGDSIENSIIYIGKYKLIIDMIMKISDNYDLYTKLLHEFMKMNMLEEDDVNENDATFQLKSEDGSILYIQFNHGDILFGSKIYMR